MMSRQRTTSGLLVTLLLTACTGLSAPKTVNQTLYTLDALPAISPATVKRNAVLIVSTPQARPGYDSSQMAYIQRIHELDSFVTNRWVSPPAHMLEPLLVAVLEQTAAFRAVAPATNTLAGDLRLDVELIRLHQDFTVKPSRVVMTLRAQLVDVRANRILAARQFEETEAATSDDAAGGAKAANHVLQRLLGQLAGFCVSESGTR